MLASSIRLERFRHSDARARTLTSVVSACRRVAVLLERARKQASLGRPRATIDAVERRASSSRARLQSVADRRPAAGPKHREQARAASVRGSCNLGRS